MKVYVVQEGWVEGQFELHTVEAVERLKSYRLATGMDHFQYRRTIQKDDTRIAFTPEEAWRKALIHAEASVTDALERVERANDRLVQLKRAMELEKAA